MNIDLFAVCYNEEEILPYFLRHYSPLCRTLTFLGSDSTDRSNEIISQYPNTRLEPLDTGNCINDEILIHTKNNCWKGSNADYVIVCDVDEFLYHQELGTFLQECKAKGINLFRPYGYEMYSEYFPQTDGQIYDTVREGIFSNKYSKSIIFDPQTFNEINYDPGAHYCDPQNKEGTRIMIYDQHNLKMLHYRFIGQDRVVTRLQNYAKRLSQLNKDNGWGIDYLEPLSKTVLEYRSNLALATNVLD